jgi:LCP family protein required for cell wall assembly
MRRAVAVGLVLAVCAVGVVAASLGGAPRATGRPFLEIGRAHAEHAPVLTGGKPIFILILGSDSRPGTPLEKGLSDSIHILGINPKEQRGTLIGIPRDSYVPLATGGTNKINAAMVVGGPEATVATVERLTGIRFDYYALSGFNELIDAVDKIGGLTIDIPYTFDGYDRTFQAGKRTLNGEGALGFARTRHGLRAGDFDRSMNQGRLLLAALGQFRKQFAKEPTTMFRWLGAGVKNVRTDLSIDELIRFAFTATEVHPKRVTNMVLIGSAGNVGGMSVVYLSDVNQRYYEDIRADGYIAQGDIDARAQPSNGT